MDKLFALGVGESIRFYEKQIPDIFEKYKTITLHNGFIKLYEKFGKYTDYYTWGDPFGALHTLRYLNTIDVIKTKILIPSTMLGTYEDFRKYHGTSRISQDNKWDEYKSLIFQLYNKGFTIFEIPTGTMKENNYSVVDRFNGDKMVMGTWKWTGDASEERCTTETKLTSLIFPLAHYLDFDEVDVLGFDLIGGRFYDKIEGVPSDPWPKHQLPLLIENMKVWDDWKEHHNMNLVSVVNDDLTINNQALEYKDISEFKLKTWSEYYKECKEVYGNSDSDINNLTIHTKHFKDDNYNNLITSLRNKLENLYQNESNYEWKNVAMGLKDIFLVEEELKSIVEDYLVPYLEKDVFGCYVHCDNIKIYKTPQVNSQESSSWVWHIDNSPVEQMKVMIYINDVNKESGAFRYLKKDNGGVKLLSTRRDYQNWKETYQEEIFEKFGRKWNGTRTPESVLNDFIQNENCEIVDVEDKAGTAIIFDNNCIHKGTIPTNGFRYAMTIQFKPVNKKLVPVFDKKYVGNGWKHVTFHKDPEIIKPMEY